MSNVIKQQSSFSPEQKRRKLSLQEVRNTHSQFDREKAENPEALMASAKAEADRVSEEAKHQLEYTLLQIEEEKSRWAEEKQRLMEEAKAEGYQEGMALGKAEAQAEYANLISRANAVTEMARQSVEEKLESAEEEIIELSVALAKKVWQQKSDDKEAFLLLVKQVIAEVKDYDDISIYVDPEYYETVHQHMDEIQQLLYKECRLSLYADEKAARGTCSIETPFGRVDAGIDTQLMQLKQKLLTALEAGAEQ
ncbi:flagellar assembly protein FliH [Bacillus sp. L381]|uniref:flagellar assembly protein FliH n=1 Tax=Bacillus TaxID=1386 RepID=UPI001BA55B6D|nr:MULTISPECIES: flagellar assembly protein FliH [Bacillus]MCR9038134.1 flagellar assembly protein FliH [Bacillus velezensis]QUN11039.1 flagellar assembly protein FliH [Bacillus amyloliquefaciens]QYM84172.1 flagellar assembly protein FliH [Bacillus sp. 7D3]QZY13353.1 flagellar assembly protein FliH [Bacillus amyloliquefaciens]WIX23167.1 flagellar assembly protein FliH [Bacillus sp. L381]